jgi:hypothetical protein
VTVLRTAGIEHVVFRHVASENNPADKLSRVFSSKEGGVQLAPSSVCDTLLKLEQEVGRSSVKLIPDVHIAITR